MGSFLQFSNAKVGRNLISELSKCWDLVTTMVATKKHTKLISMPRHCDAKRKFPSWLLIPWQPSFWPTESTPFFDGILISCQAVCFQVWTEYRRKNTRNGSMMQYVPAGSMIHPVVLYHSIWSIAPLYIYVMPSVSSIFQNRAFFKKKNRQNQFFDKDSFISAPRKTTSRLHHICDLLILLDSVENEDLWPPIHMPGWKIIDFRIVSSI